LTATTTLGGKAGWSPAPRLFLQPREALLKEPFAPLTDDLSWRIKLGCDLVIVQTLGRVENDFGPNNVPIW
jgi:hypothetical protein